MSQLVGTNATAAWSDEYSRPLGPPLAKATLLANGTFFREFASGTKVHFDTLTDVGSVSWASSVPSPDSAIM
eukprot:COSAG06_NODE_3769_length_4925_cov_76.558433_3_plen_72_part_00